MDHRPSTDIRHSLYIGLGLFVVAGLATLLLWLGLIPDTWIGGARNEKLGLWGFMAASGLLWTIYTALELRAQIVGTTGANQQFQVGKVIIGTIAFLVGATAASFVADLVLMAVFGQNWLDGRFGLALAATTVALILVVGATYWVLRRRNPNATFSATALAILMPFGMVAYTGFRLALLVLVVVMGTYALGFAGVAKLIEGNFALAMGAALIGMAAVVATLYLAKRDPAADWRTNASTLSGATWTVLVGAWIITFGGLAVLIALAVLRQ